MGSDGGICWVKLLNKEKWDYFMKDMEWRVLNEAAYAYKGEYAGPVPAPPNYTDTWLEGAHGTDCEYCLSSLCDLVEMILSPEAFYAFHSEDIKQYTFQELLEEFLTDPFNGHYTDSLDVIKKSLLTHHRSQIMSGLRLPAYIMDMKLIDWAQGVNEAIDVTSYVSEETWT